MLSYKQYLVEYKGEHEAPDKDNGAPLYDLTLNGVYPKDFYEKGISHYGDGIPNIDTESFSVIYSAKNKPNKLVKVYRAVPELNFEDKEKLKEFYNIIFYRNKYNFFPMNNKIVDEISNKINEEDYDELQKKIVQSIKNEIEKLESVIESDKKIKINNGDWVTLSLKYAKEHGRDNLNNKYKILTKTVKSKSLFNDGNSINEFGYYQE